MHSHDTVIQVLELRDRGLGPRRIAAATGIPVSTARDWLAGRLPRSCGDLCPACGVAAHDFDRLPPAYVYLLGL